MKTVEELNETEMTYLHGYCHMWAYTHFQPGDTLCVLAGSNDQSGSNDLYLIHCYLWRESEEKYIDVRGKADFVDVVLDEFADEIPDDDSYLRYFTFSKLSDYCNCINHILQINELPPHDVPKEVSF